MDTVAQVTEDVVTVTRWVARIIAVLLAGITLIFVSGADLDLAHAGTARLLEVGAFAAMWSGLLVAWRWEWQGGALTIAGMLAFFLLDFLFAGAVLRFWVFLIFALPAALFLYCGWHRRHRRPEEDQEHLPAPRETPA